MKTKLTLTKAHDYCASGQPALTVVMIHGIASNSMSFHNALKYLEGTTSLKDVRFVCYDLLGAVGSPVPEQPDTLNYDYGEQVGALHNALAELGATTPLVLVGHSMGTLIATRYASIHKKAARQLILLSPPVYTEQDMTAPAMRAGLDAFTEIVRTKDRRVAESKAFQDSMKNIVLSRDNYSKLAGLKVPTVLIYGDGDQLIGAANIPRVVAGNPEYLTAIKTPGGHSVSREKYSQMLLILEDLLKGVKED